MNLATLPVVRAKNDSGARHFPVRLIGIHTPETPDSSSAAEGVARYFQNGPSNVGSTQTVVDNDSGIRCVPDDVIPWAASGGDANSRGWHIEIAGYAAQNREEWSDAYSKVTLVNAASLCSQAGSTLGIPPRWLSDDQIRDRVTKGYCTHADITRAFEIRGGHTDPGDGFPRDDFIQLCAAGAPSVGDIAAFLKLVAEVLRLNLILGENMPVISHDNHDHDFFELGQKLMHTFPTDADYFTPENLCEVAPEAKAAYYKLHPEHPDIVVRSNAIHRSPNVLDVYARGVLGERLHWWYTGKGWHAEMTVDKDGKRVA